MANHKPVVDNSGYRVFDTDTFSGNLLDRAFDQDGDTLRVVQAGGQKIVTDKFGPIRDVIVEGKYGTFQIDQNGGYTYKFDPSKIAGIGPGQEVTESLSFKISDGHGGTDTAKTTITLDVPEQGQYVVDFENAPVQTGTTLPYVEQGYAGFYYGDEAASWQIGKEVSGNSYIVTDPFEETVRRVDGADFTIGTVKVANAGDDAEQSDAIVTFYGYNDAGEIISQKAVYVWADDISDGQEISLEDLGAIDRLTFSIERTNTFEDLDVPQLAFDDIEITVTGTSDIA